MAQEAAHLGALGASALPMAKCPSPASANYSPTVGTYRMITGKSLHQVRHEELTDNNIP
jgi:hypothetical protein